MELQSFIARRAWRKILKFTDSCFLNLARVQVNFKICARAAAQPCRRLSAQSKIDAFADSGDAPNESAAWYGARAGKLAKRTGVGTANRRAAKLKVSEPKRYRRLTGRSEQI